MITNRSSYRLNQQEQSLLSKGPKFIPCNTMNKNTLHQYNIAFQRIVYQLRWRAAFDHGVITKTPNQFLKMDSNRDIRPPPTIPTVEARLQEMYRQFSNTVQSAYRSRFKIKSNLSDDERNALKHLRNVSNQITIQPSDKGGEFCIIDSSIYTEAVTSMLNSNNTYRKIYIYDITKIEQRVNDTWRKICSRRNIVKHIMQHFLANCTQIPPLTCLVKTHKEGLKLRPIVNCRVGPCHNISWLIHRITKKFLSNLPYVVTSTEDMLEKISKITPEEIRDHPHLVSLDICDMYTAIPANEAILCLCDHLTSANFNYHGIQTQDIHDLCHVITTNGYFQFNKTVYLQFHGLPMGNVISGLLANVFVSSIERKILHTLNIPGYFRYVDDTCLFCKNSDEANRIINMFNNAHKKLQFEMEEATDNSLNILDVKLTVDQSMGTVNTQLHRKDARSDMFINRKTNLPTSTIMTIAMNETIRIRERCQTEETLKHELELYNKRLMKNGFNRQEARKVTRHSRVYRRTRDVSREDTIFLSVPFISDTLNAKIRKLFARHDIKVTLAHKGKSLKEHLKPPIPPPKCKLSNCHTPKDLCFRKMLVYGMKCNKCNADYIGSTKRHLHTRIKEHLTRDDSAIKRHAGQCMNSNNWSINIITTARDLIDLRIKEAYWIKQRNPKLNGKLELIDLLTK